MVNAYLTRDQRLFKTMIFFLAIMSALSQAGLVLYTPAFLQISKAFNITPVLVKMTLTAYLIGFGASQLFYGPLSDRWGRKKMLVGGMLIFSIGCLWSIYAKSYENFFISRVIQGIGAGSCMALSRAILRDCFNGKDYIYAASFLSTGFAIGLGITPVIGGHLVEYFSWQAEFIFLLACGIILFFIFLFFLPETFTPNEPKPVISLFLQQTFKHCLMILSNAKFICYLLGGVMAYGVVIAYTTMGPYLFQQTLGFSSVSYGWLTLLAAVAYYASTYSNRLLILSHEPFYVIKLGLYLIVFAGVIMLVPGLIGYTINSLLIIIPLFIAIYGQAFIWSNTVALALKDFSATVGTAAALFSCLQMVLSAVISAILAVPPEHNQLPMALAIILLGLIAGIIFYFNIFKKGNRYLNNKRIL